jgi:hypothetical protein
MVSLLPSAEQAALDGRLLAGAPTPAPLTGWLA